MDLAPVVVVVLIVFAVIIFAARKSRGRNPSSGGSINRPKNQNRD